MVQSTTVIDWDAVKPTTFEDWAQGKRSLISEKYDGMSKLEARQYGEALFWTGANDIKCRNFADSVMALSDSLRQRDKRNPLGQSVFARSTTSPLSSPRETMPWQPYYHQKVSTQKASPAMMSRISPGLSTRTGGGSSYADQDFEDTHSIWESQTPRSTLINGTGILRSPAMGSARPTMRHMPTQTSNSCFQVQVQNDDLDEVQHLREEVTKLKQELRARRGDPEPSECGSCSDIVPRGEQYALSQIAQQVGELRNAIQGRKLGYTVSQGDPINFVSREGFNSAMDGSRLVQLRSRLHEESVTRLRFEDSVRALETSGDYANALSDPPLY